MPARALQTASDFRVTGDPAVLLYRNVTDGNGDVMKVPLKPRSWALIAMVAAYRFSSHMV